MRKSSTHEPAHSTIKQGGENEMLRLFLLVVAAGLVLMASGQDTTEAHLRRLTRLIADIEDEVKSLKNTLRQENTTLQLLREMKEQLDDGHQERALIQEEITGVASSIEELHNVDEGDALIAVQYLPDSCSKLGSVPPGYYRLRTANGEVKTALCGTGMSPESPVSSCHSMLTSYPNAPSGYYWVSNSTGSAVEVYCDTERECCGNMGGWTRVAHLDMTDPSQQCPQGFKLRTDPKRVCVRTVTPGCTSIIFPTHGVQYSRVCGQARGYQEGSPDGFRTASIDIDGTYIDGLSITHGESPRKHIWSFAAAHDEVYGHTCPCITNGAAYTGRIPSFVGNDYFCETGSREHFQYGRFYHEDPLWDGEGCSPTTSCCEFGSAPQFCKELPQTTTDDIEVRVCTDSERADEDVAIELIELYLQ